MGVEVVGSDMAQVTVDKVTEVDKSMPHDKEDGKLDNDPVHNEPIKVGSHGEGPDKGEENNASDANFPKDAVDEWPAPKQIHSFYFVRYRPYDDPKIKAKIDQADREMQKWNKARFQLTDELKAKRSDRSELLSQVKSLNIDFEQFKAILDEKKKEMEPLQQALGKLRNNNTAGGRGGICSSEEELNDIIRSLQYRIQHESIPLTEEKQLLREIKQLEGTREKVIANAAMRAKIQDSLGQKEAIQDQVKLMGVDLDGVRKEQQAVWSNKNQIKEKVKAIESKIDSLQEELTAVTQKRDKAYETIQELRKQRDEGNAHFYQSRSLINKAKELAAKKDIKALEELSAAEVEKFMALWSGKKAFRDDYEKRILSSLDSRQLSRDGRIRNPDEKPLVVPEAPVPSETETIQKPSVRQPKEEAKSSPQPDIKPTKKVQKDGETKVVESKSSPENGVVAEKEISGLSKLQKDTSADKEVDEAKLKEMKREEEIAKQKQAMERKKKLAEKAAAKAAIRAQKDAEKKLKEREKKAKKKAAANPDEPTEAEADASEPEKVDVNADEPVPAPVSVKDKVQKENTVRYRNRTKGPESLPRAILKRKKSTNYWIWAAPAALVLLILLALGYYYLV
ncbi:proton pump-interactor 1-like [Durio zibethinus]|uniref:Proton pump-interactor 1-like n=1 Tax=Durio zibethinus TaxID=66656 RepID=A0A6P5ZLJ7_DURZI|nr:proton pump-interactor 1-like [Durio zibethinus]